MLQYKSDWLNEKEQIVLSCTPFVVLPTSKSADRGRPQLDFIECSKRTKRRRIADISKEDESIASAL